MATIATLLVKMGVLDETDEGTRSVSSGLKDFGGKMAGLAAGIGAAAGVALIASFVEAMDVERLNDKLAAQLGATAERAKELGGVAGDLYKNAYGESLADVNDAVAGVVTSIKGMSTASAEDIQKVTAMALDFATAFDVDVTRAVQSVGVLMNAGLAADAEHAFDLVVAASQRVPAHLREDLLDASDEYGQFFRAMGFSGEQMFGLLVEAADKGTFGIDKFGDAIKEGSLLMTDLGSGAVLDAYKAIGLNAHETANAILRGGPAAQTAFQKIIAGLRGIKDPSDQAAAAIALFGTPLEDLNKAEIPEFLAQLGLVGDGMADAQGAAAKMGATLNDNAAASFEGLKRTFQMGLAEALGPAMPGINDAMKQLLPTVTDLMKEFAKPEAVQTIKDLTSAGVALVPVLIWLTKGGMAITGALIQLVAWIATGVKWLFSAKGGGDAVASTWDKVTGFFSAAGQKIGAFFSGVGRFFTETIPGWGAMLWAWLSALPGRALAALQALPGLLVALAQDGLQRFAFAVGYGIGLAIRFFNEAPGKVWSIITGLWDRSIELTAAGIAAVIAWAYLLPGRFAMFVAQTRDRALAIFADLRGAAASKAGEIVSSVIGWLNTLPGRARAALFSLPGQVVGALQSAVHGAWSVGQSIVEGMIGGIRSMAGRLFQVSKDIARNAIDGAKRALGIASPSKVAALQIGVPVGEGIALGLHRSTGAVAAAGERLASAAVPHLARPGVVNPGVFGPAGAAGDGQAQTIVQVIVGGKVVEDASLRVIQGNPRAVALANRKGERDLNYT